MVSRIVSPAEMPSPSLTCLKRSMSMTNTVGRNFSSALASAIMRFQPVEEQLAVRQAGQIVVHGVVQQPLLGLLLLGDVDQRADAADAPRRPSRSPAARAARTSDSGRRRRAAGNSARSGRAGARAPRRASCGTCRGRRGAGPAASCGPARQGCWPPARAGRLTSGRVTTRSRATSQSQTVSPEPVMASACRSMSLNRPCVQRAAGKGVLHDGEADQQDDQDQAAAERRLDDVVVEHAGDRHPRAGEPDQHHHPARHQHDGAVVALEAEEDDQADADDRGAGEGEPRDAGGDRRDRRRRRRRSGRGRAIQTSAP